MNQAATRMLNTDLQGSVTSVTDFNGEPIAINRYDEYGRPQAGNVGRFQYTGQAWLPEIGLYYYKARMYSPTLGRFMQTDPIGYADGVNWYNYVGGDPVNFVDPSGLQAMCRDFTWFEPVDNDDLSQIRVIVIQKKMAIYQALEGLFGAAGEIVVNAIVCEPLDLVGETGRARAGLDAAGGTGLVGKLGGGVSVREDGSIELDLYASAVLGSVDKGDSQTRQYLIQGGFLGRLP